LASAAWLRRSSHTRLVERAVATTSDGGYLMNHSAMIYLMTADDKFDTLIRYQEKDSVALAKLRDLLATAPSS
jgi:cytochrome oxidase Cu insertion factor (SCO1/SenC/PrrC family)